MDGKLAPAHRKKRKHIYCDLYASAVVIIVVEMAVFCSWMVYYAIMLWSYNDNGGKTTQFLVDEENGEDVTRPMIPEDVIYYMLLIGIITSIVLCFLLFLGTVWLFPEFLVLWSQGTLISNIYFTVVFVIDSIFTRGAFPVELLMIPFRFYFIFIIGAFIKQIKDDAEHDYDYKRFAEDHFKETGTKFVSRNRRPTTWYGTMLLFLCAITGCARRQTNRIAPAEFADKATVMRHMRLDMEVDDTLSDTELRNADPEIAVDIPNVENEDLNPIQLELSEENQRLQ